MHCPPVDRAEGNLRPPPITVPLAVSLTEEQLAVRGGTGFWGGVLIAFESLLMHRENPRCWLSLELHRASKEESVLPAGSERLPTKK
jgi:hypothetical protein